MELVCFTFWVFWNDRLTCCSMVVPRIEGCTHTASFSAVKDATLRRKGPPVVIFSSPKAHDSRRGLQDSLGTYMHISMHIYIHICIYIYDYIYVLMLFFHPKREREEPTLGP